MGPDADGGASVQDESCDHVWLAQIQNQIQDQEFVLPAVVSDNVH